MKRKIIYAFLFVFVFCSCFSVPSKAAVTINKNKLYLIKNTKEKLTVKGTTKTITWSSGNSVIASVDKKGNVTGKKAGNTTITAKYGNKSLKCSVYVMSISRNQLELSVNESAGLSISKAPGTVSWKSANTKIASVNAQGKVKGVAAGTTTVTATCQGKSTSCKVYIPSLTLDKTTLNVGQTTKATVKNTISKITFKSSNPQIASISSNGTITAKAAGKVIITSNGYNDVGKCITVLSKTLTINSPSGYQPVAVTNPTKTKNYKESMITLLADMNHYAKSKNKNFNMIPNGGYSLYHPGINTVAKDRNLLLSNVDGVLIENIFYGYDDFNQKTGSEDSNKMQTALKNARANGVKTFNMEYCTGTTKANNVKSWSNSIGSIPYSAPALDLNVIPTLSSVAATENKANVTRLSDVKNYCALLDPGKYSSKDAYLNAIRKSNYDMLFIDLYFDGQPLTKAEVNSLKKKANGATRLICTYVCVGEAEDYRYYWNSSWNNSKPSWLDKENPDWEGNYKVRFWEAGWRNLLYGNANAYLDKAIAAGFDGAYLDVIDAYEYFE